ncbi:MAG: lipopolysaccharide biosynthesis protein [Candidatus Acidiferrales bacterium]
MQLFLERRGHFLDAGDSNSIEDPGMTVENPSGSLDRSMAHAVAWGAGARWASQVVSWASTIVVARLLTPYDYGLVGMAGLYLQLALLVSQAGIGDAVIALRDLTSRQLAELNTISLLMGAALVALSAALAIPIARFFSAPPLVAVIIVASVVLAINAFQVVPKALLQRDLRFKLLAAIETVRAFSQVIATVLFAWFGFRYWSLVLGYIISSLVGSFLTFYWRPHEFAVPNFANLRREMKFTRDALLSRIATYVYDNADFGVAGRVLGESALGNYTVAWTISAAPIDKIGSLVTGVTPAFFSAVQTNKAELSRYFLRLTEVLSFVTVPASIGIALVADYLVPVLLGPKWLGVIGPLRLLGIFVAVRSVATILPNLLTAVGHVRFTMWATTGAAVAMPIAFLIGSRWGTSGIAAAWVVAYPLIMIPMYYKVLSITGVRVREYLLVVLPALNASAIMAVVLILIRSMIAARPHSIMGLSILVIAGIVAYAAALFAFHRERVSVILHTLTRMFRSDQPIVNA